MRSARHPEPIVTVRTFASELEAQLAKAILAASGIPAVVMHDDAGGMLPSLTFVRGVRLAVRREHARRALALLDETSGGGRRSEW
jgi:Putative prokaryotic signal transducing protein